MGLKTVVVVSDLHVPYHDAAALRLVLKVCRKIKPDILALNGDALDCYAVSKHPKTWGRKADFQAELDAWEGVRRELEDVSDRRIFIAGNHEDRWPRYLSSVQGADNRRCNGIPELLGLGKRWAYVPYRDYARIGKVIVTHDLERSGKHALAQSLADAQHCVIVGHTHRAGSVYESSAIGDAHVAVSGGWLGDLAAIDYRHKIKARREWQTGFVVGYLEPSGVMHLQVVPIVKGKCVVNGELFTLDRRA